MVRLQETSKHIYLWILVVKLILKNYSIQYFQIHVVHGWSEVSQVTHFWKMISRISSVTTFAFSFCCWFSFKVNFIWIFFLFLSLSFHDKKTSLLLSRDKKILETYNYFPNVKMTWDFTQVRILNYWTYFLLWTVTVFFINFMLTVNWLLLLCSELMFFRSPLPYLEPIC